ncbi:MAG: cytochrome c oxidase assembly protein [Thiolinea sp.]
MDTVKQRSTRILLTKLFLVPVLMFGFGYLMVPLYDVFCDITGLNGKTGAISEANASLMTVDTSREIKIQFTSSVNQNGPWEFHPAQSMMTVHPGKPYTTTFIARNKLDKAVTSQSIPSVTPNKAAAHFDKMECFCFTEQKFEALEEREMPVTFIVGAAVPQEVDTITLSYTLFTKE